MDLLSLEGKNALHIIDRDTLLSAAVMLSHGETSDQIWKAYLPIWVLPYVGYSETIHTGQGAQFTSECWSTLWGMAGIKHDLSGVESHNSIDVSERYYS